MSSDDVRFLEFGPICIPADAFPSLVERHLERVANTAQLEFEGEALLASDFDSAALESFVRGVCRWGGYPGIAGRVLKNNDMDHLRSCFGEAASALRAEGARADSARMALMALNRLKGLGTPSFASKHLRFIQPAACPVLDRVIHNSCGYAFGPRGYSAYVDDCAVAAEYLDAASVRNPFPGRDRWHAADVDAAVFSHVRW